MSGWLFLGIAILFNTLGNFFIKLFSSTKAINHIFDYVAPTFLIGVGFFGLNLLFFTRSLKDIPLAVAYPTMVGTTMTAVTVLAVFYFGERLAYRDGVGIVLVFLGVALLAQRS